MDRKGTQRLEQILRSRGGLGAIPEQVSVDSDGGGGWLVTVHVNADQGDEALCRVIDAVTARREE